MTATRPTAVLFDLDGTLIDSIELIVNSARHAFDKHAVDWPSDAAWLAGVGTPLRAMFDTYATERVDTDTLIAAYREYQLAHHDRLVRCYDDVVATVDLLHARGHPMAVVTSKMEALAGRGLAHVGLLDQFETIVGCDTSTKHKPDPEPVLIALERLGYAPREAVFVGDSVHDILAGNAAGVTTVAALWGPFTRAQLAGANPTHFLDRVSDLIPLLG
jgi:pyrophosphatase PpaX